MTLVSEPKLHSFNGHPTASQPSCDSVQPSCAVGCPRQKKCSEASSLGENSISCFQTITLIFTDLKTKVDVVERTQISSDPTSSHRIIVHSHSPSTKQWTQGRCSGVVLAMHARNYQHIKRYFTHLELWNNTAHTKGTHYHYLHTHSKLVENSGRVKTDCQQSIWAKN